MIRWTGKVARMGEERNVYRILVEKCKGKSPLGKHRHTGDYNIKMDVKKYNGRVWAGFIWLRIGTNRPRLLLKR
jgi:hypothetical protein